MRPPRPTASSLAPPVVPGPAPRTPALPAPALSALVLSALALSVGTAHAQETSGAEKLYFDACPPFAEEYTFDCYHTYDEVTAFLRDVARAHPDRTRLESIGESWEGRELWVLTVTDFEAGAPEEKPAVWVDGGIDADEVVAIEAALGVAHRLLTSDEPEVRELLRTRAFYIAPVVIPDISDLHHTTPIRPRDTTARPWDDDGDGERDEDGPNDLDGDGQALRMRVEDPDGDRVADERDPRAMRDRRPDDEGPFYRVYPEAIDEDGDGEFGEDPVGGIDPNRNYPGNWSQGQGGAGPFPGSEAELRAMLDFILERPNIAASQHFHSSGGVILRPPSVPDLDLPAADERLYLQLSREGMEVTGYPLATSVFDWNWPRGSTNTRPGQIWRTPDGEIRGGDLTGYPAYGGSIDGMYLLFGVLAFANEIYTMGEDYDEDGRIDEVEQLRWDDEELDGAAFKEWEPFDHPQLGPVEIGGWRKFGHNNPLPDDLPREVERNVDFVLMQAERTPRLVVSGVEVEEIGGDVHRVRATVRNEGWQPTELAIREESGDAVPVRVTLEAGDGVELLSSDAMHELGTLGGQSSEEAEWLVRGARGARVTVRAAHPKGGTATAEAALTERPAS